MTPQPLLERLITRYPRYCNFMGYFTHKSQPVKSLRTVSPRSRVTAVRVTAVPFGILGLAAGWMLGRPWLGIDLLAASLLNRMLGCWLIGWWAAGDRMAGHWVLLYPLRDLYGFAVWCASYLKQRCLWRDTNYRLLKDGKLVAMRADGSVLDPESSRSVTPEAGRF